MQFAWRLEVIARDDLRRCPRWQVAFASERKDHRYYELVEDTLHPEFDYRYFAIKDAVGQVCAVQPFFTGPRLVGRSESAVWRARRRHSPAGIGNTPVIAMSGSADHALAAWWTLALPALDRLSGRQPRRMRVLPLARKIASSVGIAEIALLAQKNDSWVPLALGDLPFETIGCAQAWLMERQQRGICCRNAGRCLYANGVIRVST